MKRIVLCCDGTWSNDDSLHPTNVMHLKRAILPMGPDGVPQIAHYVSGVGSRSDGALQGLDRLFGGAFGAGLARNVERAYAAIVASYDPGDRIYLFGFSRGAYTARSVAGLVRSCGILDRADPRLVAKAFALYKDPRIRPSDPEALEFRARHSRSTVLDEGELAWRRANGWIDGADPARLAIEYVGVWDTVGALGVPGHLVFSHLLNWRHQFHDASLSSKVRAARHAVSIDEDRRAFEPTLWDNLRDRVGPDGVVRPGLNGGAPGDPEPYLQHWFPGDHGSVGGGGERRQLSADALSWIAEGAAERGLAIDPAAVAAWRNETDAFGPLRASGRTAAWTRWLSRAPRRGPDEERDLSAAARRRWGASARELAEHPYRPAALRTLEAVLARLADGIAERDPTVGHEPVDARREAA